MCYSRCHEQSEAAEAAARRWVDGARSRLGPASPCACGQTCGGGGRSYHCRGGSDRHVGSLLGGAFKPSRLAVGCPWPPASSGARDGLHFSGVEISPGVLRERASSQHLAPRGERRRSVAVSILSISAETIGRVRLSVPALDNQET